MKELIKKCWKFFTNREMITYIIAGVLTTLVNFMICFIFYNCLKWDENLVNTMAWIAAVVFAYVINKVWVFRDKNDKKSEEAMKFGKFIAARLFTLVIEVGGPFIFVTMLEFPFWPVKLVVAVIITVLNYILSKLFVFIKKEKKADGK